MRADLESAQAAGEEAEGELIGLRLRLDRAEEDARNARAARRDAQAAEERAQMAEAAAEALRGELESLQDGHGTGITRGVDVGTLRMGSGGASREEMENLHRRVGVAEAAAEALTEEVATLRQRAEEAEAALHAAQSAAHMGHAGYSAMPDLAVRVRHIPPLSWEQS